MCAATDLCVVLRVDCDNVRKVLYVTVYVILCIASEVNATELVMCTVLIVIMSAGCCNCM